MNHDNNLPDAHKPKALWDEYQVAAYLNLSVCTIRSWRIKGKGPAVCKLGKKAVRYRPEDVEAFIGSKL